MSSESRANIVMYSIIEIAFNSERQTFDGEGVH